MADIRRTASDKARSLTAVERKEQADAIKDLESRAKSAPELLKSYRDLARERAENIAGGLLFHWKLGKEAAALQADGKRYGERIVPTLAKALKIHESSVYRSIGLTKLWPKENEFKAKIVNRKMPDGDLIGISHLFAIMAVPEDPQADDVHAAKRELVELTFVEGFTCRALAAEIEVRYPPDRPGEASKGGGGGPKTLFGQAQRMADTGQKLAIAMEEWAAVASKGLKAVDPKSLGDRRGPMADRLAQDIEAFVDLSHRSNIVAEQLRQVHERLADE